MLYVKLAEAGKVLISPVCYKMTDLDAVSVVDGTVGVKRAPPGAPGVKDVSTSSTRSSPENLLILTFNPLWKTRATRIW